MGKGAADRQNSKVRLIVIVVGLLAVASAIALLAILDFLE
jgi:hypothetical protein